MRMKYLTLIGTALTLVVTGQVAVAESSSTNNPADIKLSPAAKTILCKQFPLNSRCADSAAKPDAKTTGGSSAKPDSDDSKTVPAPGGSGSNAPGQSGGQNLPVAPGTPITPGTPGKTPSDGSSSGGSGSMSPGSMSPGDSNSNSPSGTMSPSNTTPGPGGTASPDSMPPSSGSTPQK